MMGTVETDNQITCTLRRGVEANLGADWECPFYPRLLVTQVYLQGPKFLSFIYSLKNGKDIYLNLISLGQNGWNID